MKFRTRPVVRFGHLFIIFTMSALFTFGQTTDDDAVVVSRDDEPERTVTQRTDVRESTPRSNSIVLPRETAVTNPRSPTSTYNITLTEAQQKMMLFLDVLTKAETRAEGLRANLFEMIEKENSVSARINQIEYSLRPDQIENSAALTGSLRPEDIRADRQRFLQDERRNLESLLRQVRSSRRTLENSLQSADQLVERIRMRFEAYVEKAFLDEEEI